MSGFIDSWNKIITTPKQNKINAIEPKNQETDIASIRKNLGFADIVFRFPVTDKNTEIRLPAFLTSHSDSYSVNWNPENAYGRPDPIPLYRNTTRSISLAFKIPNQDFESANENYAAIGVLVKNLYPAYKSFGSGDFFGAIRDVLGGLAPNQIIVGAPLVRIKFANLICNSDNPETGLLGYISNFSLTMDSEAGYLIYKDDKDSFLFPRMLSFSFSFNPLHEHKIGWNTSNGWLGKEKNNFPHAVRKDGNQGTQGVNLLGAALTGDTSGVVRSFFSNT